VPKPRKHSADVFLNIPYDTPFESLCLAYICGISAFGLIPRTTLEIPGGQRRLDRIFGLIQHCRYSVHDLSRVELDPKPPRTPRFNMPFELGLSVAWGRVQKSDHSWFVCESRDFRLTKSLSDLNGTDAYIHHGSITGVFRELCNAFVRKGRQPTIQQMRKIYRRMLSCPSEAQRRRACPIEVERMRACPTGVERRRVTHHAISNRQRLPIRNRRNEFRISAIHFSNRR
jgi:hypothetical protein